MEEGMSTGLMLLAVGMITVFTILALIVIFGNFLISLVNRFIPAAGTTSFDKSTWNGAIDPKKMAAIISAVEVVTKGKAKVTSITKV